MADSPRKEIRNYVVQLLQQKEPNGKTHIIDVGGRVYAERENPVFKQEVPCVMVYFETEACDIFAGDKYNPREYMRKLTLYVDIFVDAGIDPETPAADNCEAEDKLDDLAWDIEQLIYEDHTLGQLLKDYDPRNGNGLLEGSHLVNVSPYLVNVAGERKLAAQRMEWALFYRTDAFVQKKQTIFKTFNTKFLRVGTDTNDIKPDDILIEGGGNVDPGT